MYQQHVRRYSKQGRFACPRDLILSDLTKAIQHWQDDGDQVLVLADCNDDVSSADIRHWASSLGLVEAITWIHQGDPPPTYQRGTRPIDGIFAAPQLLD